MNETLSDEPPKIDPYDYEQKPISMARPYTLKGDFETLVPEIMDHHWWNDLAHHERKEVYYILHQMQTNTPN